jgi:hypothetical protein
MSDIPLIGSPLIDEIAALQPPAAAGWARRPQNKFVGRPQSARHQGQEVDAYLIAQHLRTSMAALTGANAALGLAQGVLSTTLSGLNCAADELLTLRALLVALAEGEPGSPETRTIYDRRWRH